jgi:hypothetical protein
MTANEKTPQRGERGASESNATALAVESELPALPLIEARVIAPRLTEDARTGSVFGRARVVPSCATVTTKTLGDCLRYQVALSEAARRTDPRRRHEDTVPPWSMTHLLPLAKAFRQIVPGQATDGAKHDLLDRLVLALLGKPDDHQLRPLRAETDRH